MKTNIKGKSFVQKIKDKYSDLSNYLSGSSHGDIHGVVHVLEAPFYERMLLDFPEPIVINLTEKDVMHEAERFFLIATQLCEANDLPLPELRMQLTNPFDAMGTASSCISFNPVFTKGLNDDELAFVLGHEMAHCFCGHSYESVYRAVASSLIDKVYKLSDSDNAEIMSNMYFQAIEHEADIIGMKFSLNAGYHKVKLDNVFNNSSFEDYFMDINYNYNADHPSNIERQSFLDICDFKKVDFNLEERQKYIEDLRLRTVNHDMPYKDISSFISVERDIFSRLQDYIVKDKELYCNRIDKLNTISMSDKIKTDYYISEYQNSERFVYVNEKSLSHRTFVIDNYNDKLDKLKEVASQIHDEIKLKDRALKFVKILLKTKKKRIGLEMLRSVVNNISDSVNEAISNKKTNLLFESFLFEVTMLPGGNSYVFNSVLRPEPEKPIVEGKDYKVLHKNNKTLFKELEF